MERKMGYLNKKIVREWYEELKDKNKLRWEKKKWMKREQIK